MTTLLVIDEAWTKIDPAKAKADGYGGVIGYLSGDSAKNITQAIAAQWHAAGLSVGLVWETSANRAAQGAPAGRADVSEAERQAHVIGVPLAIGIYYATDFDATPAQVNAYYAAIAAGVGTYQSGCYGSRRVLEAMVGTHVRFGWQACAWSSGVSPRANIYQRPTHTRPPINGGGGYDENIVLSPAGLWTHTPTSPPVKPPPVKSPIQTPVKSPVQSPAKVPPVQSPAKRPPVVEKGVKAPPFPLPSGRHFGPEGGGPNSISGYHGHATDLAQWQARMIHRGWTLTADGHYGAKGDLTPRGQTAGVVLAAQHDWGIGVDSIIGPVTWANAWTKDVVHP